MSTNTAARAPLRILFSTWNYFPAPAGGAERQAQLQAEELRRRGHEVVVMCPRVPGFKSGNVGGIEVHRLLRIDRRPWQRISYFAAMTWFLARNLRRFDLVHVHLANFQADVVVALARLLRRPSYVKLASGGAAGEIQRLARLARVTRWYGLRHATRVQALSAEIEAELRTIGVDGEQVVRITNGMAFDGFAPPTDTARREARARLELPPDRTLVLFIGRFAHYKGVLDLVDGWHLREHQQASLVLVGDAKTDNPVGPIPPAHNIVIRPWQADVRPYLEAADVFVNPSHSDGMSNALLEAMAFGLPIIATRVGNADEMLEQGHSGILVQPQNPAMLSDALERLLADSELRRHLGRAARRSAERFHISAVVDRIEAAYRGMVPDK